jgi:nucleoside-diphosphate-sugar epimerase
MRVLVTGATGFIGGHVVEALREAGHEPVAAVRATSDVAFLERLGVARVRCDVTDRASLLVACKGVDCVIHTAAIVATYGSWEPYRRVGVEGTANVVEAAVAAGVPRLVHLGSIAVHGLDRQPGRVIREDAPLAHETEPWNHYVREKVLSEKIVWRAHDAGRIQVTSLRPSVVLGPRDRAVVTRMVKFVDSPFGGVIGTGSNRVGCVDVTDLARLAVLAATRREAVGRAYNASSTQVVTQREIVGAFGDAFGRWRKPWRAPYAIAMLTAATLDELYATLGMRDEPIVSRISVAIFGNDFLVDCSRAERDLGWRGDADLRETIARSVEWYVAHR